MRRLLLSVALGGLATSFGCASVIRPVVDSPDLPPASLWEAPRDLHGRDLFAGPWGLENAPDPQQTYRLLAHKHTGVNPGMTVVDSLGREWSVKQAPPNGQPPEGPVEVTLSRVLSALGYHQPPVYYLPSFTLSDDWGIHTEPGGRFRLKTQALKDRGGWSWHVNPFVGTKPYQGLLVILQMFGSSDLKSDNNTLYEYRGDVIERWYVVRDLGTALGETGRFAPRRADPDVFARQRFIRGLRNGLVDFDFRGRHQELLRERISVDDVAWACELANGLTDRQWADAFRAGGFAPEVAALFIQKLRANIALGQQIAAADRSLAEAK